MVIVTDMVYTSIKNILLIILVNHLHAQVDIELTILFIVTVHYYFINMNVNSRNLLRANK